MADKDPLILDFTNGEVFAGADLDEYYASGLDDDEQPVNWDDIDLEDMFDLPPVLPPVRLPEEAELAVQARRSALLADLRALAGEVRTTMVHAAAVNPVLLRLAEEAELAERDGEDLAPALDALRRQVFASGEYLKPSFYGDVFDLPEPGSLDDLFEQEQYWEFLATSGTHSIIDIASVVPADFADEEFRTIRPLSDAECVELFGVAQPGRADYAPLANSERLDEYVTGGRWTGRAAVLWADGAPAEIAFWGYSGD